MANRAVDVLILGVRVLLGGTALIASGALAVALIASGRGDQPPPDGRADEQAVRTAAVALAWGVAAVALAADIARGGSGVGVAATVRRTDEGLVSVAPQSASPAWSPVPAWDLVNPANYGFSAHQSRSDVVYPVLASRGCPYPCLFCELQGGAPYRLRPVDAVIDEINALHDRFGARHYFLADPTFAVRRQWAIDFCDRLVSHGPQGIEWAAQSRTDRVDPELLRRMSDAGCFNILFGIESLNPAALRGARKQLDPATVEPAIRWAKRAGLEVIASVMIGLPGDTPAEFSRTVSQLIAMEPDFAQFFVVQIAPEVSLPGGRLVSEWQDDPYDFPGHMYAADAFGGSEELLSLRSGAYRRFYLRPRYVWTRLRRMARGRASLVQWWRAARGTLLAVQLSAGGRLSADRWGRRSHGGRSPGE